MVIGEAQALVGDSKIQITINSNMSAYVSCVLETINDCLDNYSHLFEKDELALCSELLALNEQCINLISRMILRMNEWVLTKSLEKYVTTKDCTLLDILEQLEKMGLVVILRSRSESTQVSVLYSNTFNDIWEGMKCSLTLDDWKSFHKVLKMSDQSSKRKELLQLEVKIALLSQKPIFGTFEGKTLNIIDKILNPSCSSSINMPRTYIVKLCSSVVRLLRRVQRLAQISTNTSNADVSIHQCIDFNAPLLCRFKKIKFPAYKINRSTPLFTYIRKFHQFENAVEIYLALALATTYDSFIKNMPHQSNNPYSNTNKHSLSLIELNDIQTLHSKIELVIKSSILIFNTHPIILHRLPIQFSRLNISSVPQESQLNLIHNIFSDINFVKVNVVDIVNYAFDNYTRLNHYSLPTTYSIPVSSTSSFYDYYSYKLFNYEIMVSLLSTLCLISYVQETYYNKSEIECSSTVPSIQLNSISQTPTQRPDFLIGLDAGTKLLLAANVAVNELEKLPYQNYPMAITLLQFFLSLPQPYLQHRRSRWYNRLCVDLEHAGGNSEIILLCVDSESFNVKQIHCIRVHSTIFVYASLQFAKVALADATTRVGDRILFEKRINRLSKRLEGQRIFSDCTQCNNIFPPIQILVHDIVVKIANIFNLDFTKSSPSYSCTTSTSRSLVLSSRLFANIANFSESADVTIAAVEPGATKSPFNSRQENFETTSAPCDKENTNAKRKRNSVELQAGKQAQAVSSPACLLSRENQPEWSISSTKKKMPKVKLTSPSSQLCPPPSLASLWNCSRCTLRNASVNLSCDACGNIKSATTTSSRIEVVSIESSDDEVEVLDGYIGSTPLNFATTSLLKTLDAPKKSEKKQCANISKSIIISASCVHDEGSYSCPIEIYDAKMPEFIFETLNNETIPDSASTSQPYYSDFASITENEKWIFSRSLVASDKQHLTSKNTRNTEVEVNEQDFMVDAAFPYVENAASVAEENMPSSNAELPMCPMYLYNDDLIMLGLQSINESTKSLLDVYDTFTRKNIVLMNTLLLQSIESQHVVTGFIKSELLASEENTFVPASFSVSGRRFGDTSFAKGKSKFWGQSDTICNVEEFMLEHFYYHPGNDEEFDKSYVDAIDCGGWQGWHCEGAPIRSLFALLMWDVIFCELDDVFQTPYQDAPLDFLYPSFCRNSRRLPRLITQLKYINAVSDKELLHFVSAQYRKYYRQQCRCMSWSHELPTLQLIALCLHGPTLAHICRAYSVNYKYLSAGFPDLLLIRISSVAPSERGGATKAMKTIDIATILGENWQMKRSIYKMQIPVDLFSLSKKPGLKPKRRQHYDQNSVGTWSSYQKNENKDLKTEPSQSHHITDSMTNGLVDAIDSQCNAEILDVEDVEKIFLDSLLPPLDCQPSFIEKGLQTKVDTVETLLASEQLMQMDRQKYDPFQYQGPELVLPVEINNYISDAASSSTSYVFESMFIEVKGPNDKLASNQILWQRVLAQSRSRTYVGWVKESSINR